MVWNFNISLLSLKTLSKWSTGERRESERIKFELGVHHSSSLELNI